MSAMGQSGHLAKSVKCNPPRSQRGPGPSHRAVAQILSLRQNQKSSSLRFDGGGPMAITEYGASNVAECVGGCYLDQHPRRPIGARPDHARVRRYIAGLYAVRWPLGLRHQNAAELDF